MPRLLPMSRIPKRKPNLIQDVRMSLYRIKKVEHYLSNPNIAKKTRFRRVKLDGLKLV